MPETQRPRWRWSSAASRTARRTMGTGCLAGELQLRVVEPDGGRVNDQHGPRELELGGGVTHMDLCATRAELLHLFVGRQVGAGHAMAQIQQQMAKTTHPTAARADQ